MLCAGAVLASDMSECEERRFEALINPHPLKLVPECDDDGNYKGLQCMENDGPCQCWTSDGEPITQYSNGLKDCECILERNTVLNANLIGAHAPDCLSSGFYAPKQCSASTGMCWCVTTNGEPITSPVQGPLDC